MNKLASYTALMSAYLVTVLIAFVTLLCFGAADKACAVLGGGAFFSAFIGTFLPFVRYLGDE